MTDATQDRKVQTVRALWECIGLVRGELFDDERANMAANELAALLSREPRRLLEERYWCGCVRYARWDRCEEDGDLEHDEEPRRSREPSREPPVEAWIRPDDLAFLREHQGFATVCGANTDTYQEGGVPVYFGTPAPKERTTMNNSTQDQERLAAEIAEAVEDLRPWLDQQWVKDPADEDLPDDEADWICAECYNLRCRPYHDAGCPVLAVEILVDRAAALLSWEPDAVSLAIYRDEDGNGWPHVLMSDGSLWQWSMPGWERIAPPVGTPPDLEHREWEAHELDRLRGRISELQAMLGGEHWVWEEDGENHLESIASGCPVLIMPRTLERLLARSREPSREPVIEYAVPEAVDKLASGEWRVITVFAEPESNATRPVYFGIPPASEPRDGGYQIECDTCDRVGPFPPGWSIRVEGVMRVGSGKIRWQCPDCAPTESEEDDE